MPAAKGTIDRAMGLLAGTNSLIVDMRNNQGGDSDTVDYLLGYFFAKSTEIAITTQRVGGRLSVHHEFTAPDVGAERYLDRPVYVLIGKATVSGGEMFAYSMQSLHRATLIGTTTAGASNGLGSEPYFLSAHLRMSVPDTRIVNPYTHANWEGGVVPDVVTASDGALLAAYERALQGAPKSLDPLGELAAALRDPAGALRDSFPAL
ncbi:MAG: S41 family peptidase [Candidatus Eremiobacteraeota bacterium]|nr:S41 family peptidase [Candidatus Eremiobacteraeota bacterium]